MKLARTERIKAELRLAEEYLHAAGVLHGRGLFNPAVSLAHSSALHAVAAAFLTAGTHGRVNPSSIIESLARFDQKLMPLIKRLRDDTFQINAIIEHDEKEALLRIHQTKELVMEVRDFLRRAVK